jgi:aminopeptidase YwaD
MRHIRNTPCLIPAAVLLAVSILTPVFAQEGFKEPETILPRETLRAVLDEVSGQLAYNNIVGMAGVNRIRTPEEMSGYLFEADYLYKKLKGYGLDEVTIESLKYVSRATWWIGHDARLTLVEPEKRLLARLEEQPALIVRGSDTVDCEGPLVFLERRDLPKIAEMDLAGKIVLTPDYPSLFTAALEKGALGIISYQNSISPLDDPDQVMFDMRFEKGKAAGKAFGLRISTRLGLELREMVLSGRKAAVHVKTDTKDYPWKADTVFAAIRGTSPEKKGLMFTAHLFERPAKIGANDNVSGCAALAEIARALTVLIRDGRIPRPERSIYFLMSEEGSGTAAFFKTHPEMAGRVLGDINMDMVGEGLNANNAALYVESPPYSKATYLDAVVGNFAEYVSRTNVEKHGVSGSVPNERFPLPIVEKNGTRDAFRYARTEFSGGSDHAMFIETDTLVPALSLMVWPDLWYHTDKDTPDKSDPTQMKRVAFIGACSALAVSGGKEETVMRLARTAWLDRVQFIQGAFGRGVASLADLGSADGGKAFGNAGRALVQSGLVSREALSGIRELAAGKPSVLKYVDRLIAETGRVEAAFADRLKSHYAIAAETGGFKPEPPMPAPGTAALAGVIPVKSKAVLLGDILPYEELFGVAEKDPALQAIVFEKMGGQGQGFLEFYILIDGRRTLAAINDLLNFEYGPLDGADLMKVAKALEAAKLIRFAASR